VHGMYCTGVGKEDTQLHIAVFAFVYLPLLVGVHPAHI
jgi:hypothetical protein